MIEPAWLHAEDVCPLLLQCSLTLCAHNASTTTACVRAVFQRQLTQCSACQRLCVMQRLLAEQEHSGRAQKQLHSGRAQKQLLTAQHTTDTN
jgi:hypothetical protein